MGAECAFYWWITISKGSFTVTFAPSQGDKICSWRMWEAGSCNWSPVELMVNFLFWFFFFFNFILRHGLFICSIIFEEADQLTIQFFEKLLRHVKHDTSMDLLRCLVSSGPGFCKLLLGACKRWFLPIQRKNVRDGTSLNVESWSTSSRDLL